MLDISFFVAISHFASRVLTVRRFPPWLRAIAKVCAAPWTCCAQKLKDASFSAAILTADARAACLPLSSRSSSRDLLLLSYPLHPPRKPAELRTAHFPQLKTPSLFVHGGRDPFGSHDEMKAALALIPAKTMLLEIEGAGHELLGKKTEENLPSRIVQAFQEFFAKV